MISVYNNNFNDNKRVVITICCKEILTEFVSFLVEVNVNGNKQFRGLNVEVKSGFPISIRRLLCAIGLKFIDVKKKIRNIGNGYIVDFKTIYVYNKSLKLVCLSPNNEFLTVNIKIHQT